MSQDITENIGQRVRELIVERLRLSIDPGELSDDEPLFAEDDFDSIGSLEIIDAIERTFDFDIPDEDLTEELLYSVGSLRSYVEMQLSVVRR
ncbi:MAG: acyl carrier protein [Gemmatimonadetes bacterium]|jgi:acyl carrier protein|nr:acyl carrier protein [Gemmatimonadota bacterium]MBT4610780.1 acyl carrier protein [Gemmatimonadota bacterium]MBT5054992.1 acyl carrier protein [Gemmatimonadota bacterium]MBT5145061.1 acyl carrier protein [Gemmatimonadota bacterium]MBT5592090.1 acyl carrier protein [Gemmatimonadota bacterium]